ncbi:unnamed protein product [Cylicostephanus goldi]|uniref:Uncharacterized protein n=1 Tax=Cylicostephanus goldi TaxID=71465 RepID=A0A3P6SFY3_CYLGO|nr:unnamed protein product [Cylicostephanus goldi]
MENQRFKMGVVRPDHHDHTLSTSFENYTCIKAEWLRNIPDNASSSVKPSPDVRTLANEDTSDESLGEFGMPCGNDVR